MRRLPSDGSGYATKNCMTISFRKMTSNARLMKKSGDSMSTSSLSVNAISAGVTIATNMSATIVIGSQ